MRPQSMLTAVLAFVMLAGCGIKPEDPVPEPSPVTQSSKPDITDEPVSAEPDFSQFAGTWHTENSMRELTVYENGGFALKDGTVLYEGFLSAEEQPGTYGLYLEDSSRLGNNMTLTMDSAHPGTLTLAEGQGA